MPKLFAAALGAVLVLTSVPALADDRRDGRRGDARWHQSDHDRGDRGYARHGGKHNKHVKKHHRDHRRGVVVWHGKRHWGGPPRRVVHHHVHKPNYDRRGSHYRRDRDDWAVYAILALQLVEVLNSQQQQSYAWATQQAAAAPLGDSIQWHDSGAYGSVTPVRDGADGSGRYCREFQHQIVVGNRQQSGYGIACRQPDGAWEIVS